MLERWQKFLDYLKRLHRMQSTLKLMKGEMEQCYKPY